MGYVNILWDAISHRVTHPNGDMVKLARRLSRGFVQQWWQHANRQDLEHVRIYETVRADIAYQQKYRIEAMINGIAAKSSRNPFVAAMTSPSDKV